MEVKEKVVADYKCGRCQKMVRRLNFCTQCGYPQDGADIGVLATFIEKGGNQTEQALPRARELVQLAKSVQ